MIFFWFCTHNLNSGKIKLTEIFNFALSSAATMAFDSSLFSCCFIDAYEVGETNDGLIEVRSAVAVREGDAVGDAVTSVILLQFCCLDAVNISTEIIMKPRAEDA